jgi:hypothetical protein
LATYQRSHLLARSLRCYEKQRFDNDRFELVVIDDHSTDATRDLVTSWSRRTGIRSVLLTPGPKEQDWRDCGAVLNYGIRAAAGDHIILTHPEVMPGRRSVAALVDALDRFEDGGRVGDSLSLSSHPAGLYASCKVYYLSPRDQERIDTVHWNDEGPLAVRGIEGFYDRDQNEDTVGNADYSHRVTDLVATPGFRIRTWDSWVFGGCSRETWKRLGGMMETRRWGSVDVLFNDRRKKLGMAEWTCPDDDTIVTHQNHDLPGDVKTDRDMAAWQRECKQFDLRPEMLCHPVVDNLGW